MTDTAASAPVDEFLPELRWTTAPTPAGPVVIVYSPEDEAVRASGVAVPQDGEPEVAAIGRLLQDVMERLEATDPQTAAREMNPLPVGHGTVAEALQAYADGQVDALAALKVKQPGTEFRQQVWQAMRLITPGAPVTYGELAQLVERPQAVRAAGSACAENLCAVVVPCHRVVRSGGSANSVQRTGNYLYGAGTKTALLEFEAAHAGS
ncbi:methylated-DNA--[protein]-cysteine S-methyltransferase [Micrococcus terreus]|uniref:methylated-DNA--[protein]-cysteine S-methyltransferase n=1 Tax=Micrococcus terreus TaxID=574650 RepID=UPI00254D357E|nr:methylated-DNA--[protein]-cysteine S-methyltransferase [Micrococcus terreus]MDK7700533.1 methylated-DNA--[protein]-cysteine S-methyltransferase [Micrococcus terreus]WOO97601.1 methylated-DNA--[protein]-cysteine S-methyltransferase [Micrococcus terreus]